MNSGASHIRGVGVRIAALVIIVAVHSGAARAPFHFDDYVGIVDNPSVRSASYFLQYWTNPRLFTYSVDTAMYRPVTMTSYLLNYLSGSYRPIGWHLTNILLHVANALLIMLLARRIYRSELIGIAAGLIFGCHPLVVESVAYVSARSGLLCAFFGLSALLIVGKETGGKTRATVSALLYALALLSKENAAAFPAIALLFGLSAPDDEKRRRWFYATGEWAALLLLYLAWRKWGLDVHTLAAYPNRSFYSNILTQIPVWARYLRSSFLPYGISVVYGMNISEGWLDAPMNGMSTPLTALLIIAALIVFVVAVRKKAPEIFLGAGWFFLSLIPESVVSLNQIANDRRVYFPMVGLTIAAVGAGLRITANRPKFRRVVPTIIVVLFSIMAIHRVGVWKSNIALWKNAAHNSPSATAAWVNLGRYYMDVGLNEKALFAFRTAYSLRPNEPSLLTNIGVILVKDKRLDEAAALFGELTQKYPRYPEGWYNLGTTLLLLEKNDEAEAAFHSLLEIAPGHPKGHLNLGNILYRKGDLENAKREFGEALKFDPEMSEAKRNLRILERLPNR